MSSPPVARTLPARWKVWLAFAIIYLVWGSTFLAIRIGVREVPPLLLAGMRFVAAGGVLCLWMGLRGVRLPTLAEWGSATLLGAMMFLISYGLLFWAETRVPSGLAAVTLAIIPAFTAVAEILIIGGRRLDLRLTTALLIGIGGVVVLMSTGVNLRQSAVDTLGACGLVVAAISWSVGTALTRKLPLPAAKAMSSGAQMFVGGVLLIIAAKLLGEFRGFHIQELSYSAWFALAYLIVAGSVVAFTAYLWLIHHESPTKVSTYAYVNPIVAVFLGYFLAGEAIGPRTVAATLLVFISVVLITTAPDKIGAHAAHLAVKPHHAPHSESESA